MRTEAFFLELELLREGAALTWVGRQLSRPQHTRLHRMLEDVGVLLDIEPFGSSELELLAAVVRVQNWLFDEVHELCSASLIPFHRAV